MQVRSVNKVILVGRVGQDPDIKNTKNNNKIARISIATTHSPKNGDDETTWHNVTFFGSTANFIADYIGKGDLVFAEGYLKRNSWENKNGKHSKLQINGTRLNTLVSNTKKSDSTDNQEEDDAGIPF